MNNIFLLLRLYVEFFKTGLFAVGGGAATIPFLADMADRTGWFTKSMLANMVAVAESTPGPIGINAATYVGFTVYGVLGGIVATLGLISPSLIVIIIISRILEKFRQNRLVKTIFYFLRPASVALIFSAFVSLFFMAFLPENEGFTKNSIYGIVLAAAIFILSNYAPRIKNLHPICFIMISALMGIIIY